MQSTLKKILVVLFFLLGVLPVRGEKPQTVVPQRPAEWWHQRHEEKLREIQENKDDIGVVLIGDSITHFIDHRAPGLFESCFEDMGILNLGYSADKTENVLWRLQNGEIDGISPKLTIIIIGTNNTGHRQDPAEETAAGIELIVKEVRERLPESKILLLSIFPRGATPDDPLRKLNTQVNRLLPKLANDPMVTHLDINEHFLDEHGNLPKTVMSDLLHPDLSGYKIWVEAMKPTVDQLLAKSPKQKPNIVHILVDDLGWQDVVCYDVDGKTIYETPNLDRLAANGKSFTQAYAPSPTCAPSRAAYLTGQYPVNTGVYHVRGGMLPRPVLDSDAYMSPYHMARVPVDKTIISEVLRDAGYVSGHVGKWHVGGKSAGYPFPLDQGFDFGYREDPGKGGRYYNDSELWDPKEKVRNVYYGSWSRMEPDRVSDFATAASNDPYQLDDEERPFDKPLDLAIGFIKNNKEKPFFLNYCPYFVHGPVQTRDKKRLEYYCKKLGHDFPTDPGAINDGSPGSTNPYYASMVDTLDWMVGEVVNYLEETDDPRNPGHKLIDNTFIIVSSDNGGFVFNSYREFNTSNAPLKGGKMSPYEGGVRIPFIVRGPNVPKGTRTDTIVSLIDLFPTFMAMAGLEPSDELDLDGCNILPVFIGDSDVAYYRNNKPRDRMFFYYPIDLSGAYSMRKGQWKIYRNLNPGGNSNPEIELFRLQNDDGSFADLSESKNMANEKPELTRELLGELDSWMKSKGVPFPYRNPMHKPYAEKAKLCPKVVDLGYRNDKVWIDFETGSGKSKIVEATLFYTVNAGGLAKGRGNEEWFILPAKLSNGRAEALVPPGTTHAAFCMRDSNGFIVYSEPVPSYDSISPSTPDSEILKYGYAYRPGLFALIKLGRQAEAKLKNKGRDYGVLTSALAEAEKIHVLDSATNKEYCNVIRNLRNAIRDQKGIIPEAENMYLNFFPQGGNF